MVLEEKINLTAKLQKTDLCMQVNFEKNKRSYNVISTLILGVFSEDFCEPKLVPAFRIWTI